MASDSTLDSGPSAENPLSLSIFSQLIRNQHQQTTPTQINPLSIFRRQIQTMTIIRTTDTDRMSQHQGPTRPQGDNSDSGTMEGYIQTGVQERPSNIGMVGYE